MLSSFKALAAVGCLIFALSFPAPGAHADSITNGTINFTVDNGSPTPTGSFVFDNTTSTFTSFTVDWDGAVFNFASILTLGDLGSSGFWCVTGPWFIPAQCSPVSIFSFFTADMGSIGTHPEADTFSNRFAGALGFYTVTETTVATPEPSTIALTLSAIGLVFAMRKRWASGLQQTS